MRGGEACALTLVLQWQNRIGNAGASGLAEGLKVNSCLQRLVLVSVFVCCLFLMWAMRKEGVDGALCLCVLCRMEIKYKTQGL